LFDRSSAWLIRFNVFVTGAAVMALEIMASRLLAPVFGDSVFVWGSLIGIIMTSLALGYYAGGRLADRRPTYRTFSLVIFLSGVLTLLIPIDAPIVLEVVFKSGLGDRYGPVVASLLLLAAPTTLLGMLSPYAIKLAAVNLSSVGGTSGSLYSISTGGSIFGTFFTVFVLIPSFGVRTIISSIGVILIAISLLGLERSEKVVAVLLAAVLMMPSMVLLSGALQIHSGSIIYQRDTPYNTLIVVDDQGKGVRTLWLNSMPHSAMYLDGSTDLVFPYTDYFHMAFVFNPRIRSVLFIGGGGFSGPKNFLHEYPNMTIDVVEIDPEVVKAAKIYFDVPEDLRLGIFVKDGRAFLDAANKTYDLMVLDAYSKTHVPFHLMTLEFFGIVYSHLSDGGVVVSNFIASFIGDTSDLLRAEYKTVSMVFPQIYIFHTHSSSLSQTQNMAFVATKDATRYGISDLIAMADDAPNRRETLAKYASTLFEYQVETGDVPVLTDDYAPTEKLLNPVTGAPYEGGEELIPISSISPLLMAAVWCTTLVSIYFISTKARRAMG
jgi:spermidine synthase